MKICTVITTYRRPLLLKRAINSVLKQTHPDFQVCVYDNASDDQTEEIVNAFMKKDSRVIYYRHPENIGMMPNYKFAFDRINTPFFSFLSDDDFLLPNFYETALEGFRQFPDAAFSACGIVQMDELGNFIGDPLSLWKSEGYYPAEDGLIEMIKTRFRFPVPTGILFQTKVVGDIKPNYSKDLDFFWDPEYLMRIAARHSVVVSKKPCGIYLAHSLSFASSFYSKLSDDATLAEKYLTATKLAREGIEKAESLSLPRRRLAIQLFNKYVRQDAAYFVKCYVIQRKLGKAHFLSKRYYHHYGFSLCVCYYHFWALALKGINVALKAWFSFYARLKYSMTRNPVDMKSFRGFHEYGQKLLDDDF